MSGDEGERAPIPIKPSRNGQRVVRPARRALPEPEPPPMPVIEALLNEQLDPELRLNTVLEMSRRAYEELQEASDLADSYGAADLRPGMDESDWVKKRNQIRDEVRRLFNRWNELQSQVRHAETEVRRRKLELPLEGANRKLYEEIRDELRDEYGSMGPHYELLCDNLAAVSLRLRQMEQSGRDYESGEYVEIHKLYLSYINQLQKYTEAMKTESINRQTQEVAERLVQIFERHFGTAHPIEWKECVDEIRTLIEEVA